MGSDPSHRYQTCHGSTAGRGQTPLFVMNFRAVTSVSNVEASKTMRSTARMTLRCAWLALGLTMSPIGAVWAADQNGQTVPAVAVLDFVNRAPGDGHDWLGKGLADMLMTDLSVSPRVSVVHRERVQELAREFELAANGIVDEGTAPRLGRTAHANWVLLGSYLRQEGHLSIEALLVDVDHQKTLRLERVDGPFNDLFRLQRELTQAFLSKLDVTMTAGELDQASRLQTRSLPAFEHFARCLALFDKGLCYDALGEARLARKADPSYLVAGARIAQLYFEIGDPEHSLVEYERLIKLDQKDLLPDAEYFKMANLLELAFDDNQRAESIFERILKRNAAYDVPFRITDPPPPPYDGWDAFGGQQKVAEIARKHEAYLESMERLARRRLREGKTDDAAKLYSQISRFTWTHGLALTGGAAWSGLNAKVDRHYPDLYWQLVRENRNATFYLPGAPNSFYLLPANGVEVDQDTKPTHGYSREKPACWLAPPDYEIAKVEFAILPLSRGEQQFVNGKNLQISFSGYGCLDLLNDYKQAEPDGEWHTMPIGPGVRAMRTFVHRTDRWKFRFHLRKWSGNPAVTKSAQGFQVNFLPDEGVLYLNGEKRLRASKGVAFRNIELGTYDIEVRWDDGRKRSTSITVETGHAKNAFLNADLDVISQQQISPSGCQSQLLVDHGGRIWLLWDDSMTDGFAMQINQQADLFCVTSLDGVTWTSPRRLPVSSFACDLHPSMQQDRRGTFWLAWISNRGSEEAGHRLWIASSPNGVDWSFPRQVEFSDISATALERLRSARPISFGFAIDHCNEFWLAVGGALFRSDDAVTWKEESTLRTVDGGKDNIPFARKSYHLAVAANNDLLMVDNFVGRQGDGATSQLWRRHSSGEWHRMGDLAVPATISWHGGSAVPRRDGSVVTITGVSSGIQVREFDTSGTPTAPLEVASYLNKAFHPSLAILPGGRYLAVYGSTDGLIASVFQRAPSAAK